MLDSRSLRPKVLVEKGDDIGIEGLVERDAIEVWPVLAGSRYGYGEFLIARRQYGKVSGVRNDVLLRLDGQRFVDRLRMIGIE